MQRTAVADVGPYALKLTLETKTLEMHSFLQPHQRMIDDLLTQRVAELVPECDILALIAELGQAEGHG